MRLSSRFLEKDDTFEGRSHVRTWLFGILFHKIMEVGRMKERERQTEDIDELMERRFDVNGSWSRPPSAVSIVMSRRRGRLRSRF